MPAFHTRFAPSPTGYLHLGNLRTALLCFLYARKEGGQLTLRIDDTDTERSKEIYAEAIQRDLDWLGISWDHIAYQSKRMEAYAAAVQQLKASGRLYPCYESQEELEIKRKMQLSRGLPPIYDREAQRLSDTQKAAYEKEGRMPHWRFLLEEKEIVWEDEIRGPVQFQSQHMSDPILVRENGLYTYMLPSTVDDIEMGITHVLRGEDHVSNTAIQIQLFEALGGKVPTFAHNALIKSSEGKLSKRKGSEGMETLKEAGIASLPLASFLARVGSSHAVDLAESMEALIEEFSIQQFSRATCSYQLDDITRLNTKWLHGLSFEQAATLFPAGSPVEEDFWLAVRGNIAHIDEANAWWNLCHSPITPVIDATDQDFLAHAAKLLPPAPWDSTTWKSWTGALKEATDRKGRSLFMPLRQALTAMDHGPELGVLLPLMAPERVRARLQGKEA